MARSARSSCCVVRGRDGSERGLRIANSGSTLQSQRDISEGVQQSSIGIENLESCTKSLCKLMMRSKEEEVWCGNDSIYTCSLMYLLL